MLFYKTQAEIRKEKNHPKPLSERRVEDIEEKLDGLNVHEKKWKYGLEYIAEAIDRIKHIERK